MSKIFGWGAYLAAPAGIIAALVTQNSFYFAAGIFLTIYLALCAMLLLEI